MATATSTEQDGGKGISPSTIQFVSAQDSRDCKTLVDPRIFFCQSDDGCEIFETCDDDQVVQIGDLYFKKIRLKGLVADKSDCYTDPGVHLHLACSPDGLIVRLTGEDILEALTKLKDKDLIDAFCLWLLENCFDSPGFVDWVCDTITSSCFADEDFASTFCEWFIDVVLADETCKEAFVDWLIKNFLDDPKVLEAICDTLKDCLENDSTVRDLICNIVRECLEENPELRELICDIVIDCFDRSDVKDKLCEVFNECLDRSELVDKICSIVEICMDDPSMRSLICEIIKTDCIVSCSWNSNTDPDPVGSDCQDGCTHMIDQATGCITHLCVGGKWVCL